MDRQDELRRKREGHALLLADTVEFIGMGMCVIIVVGIGYAMFRAMTGHLEWALAATLGLSWVPVWLVLRSAERLRTALLDPSRYVRARHVRGDD